MTGPDPGWIYLQCSCVCEIKWFKKSKLVLEIIKSLTYFNKYSPLVLVLQSWATRGCQSIRLHLELALNKQKETPWQTVMARKAWLISVSYPSAEKSWQEEERKMHKGYTA